MSTRKQPAAAATASPPAFFNPFPKYLQVRQMLERRLLSDFQLGQQLPTEAALCAEFGVSRETVREALSGLEEAGVIERRRAKGTFMVRRPERAIGERLTGLVEDYTALKLDTHAQVLHLGPVRVPQGDEPAFCIRRLRYFEGQPLVLHEAYVPPAIGERLAALDLTHASISQLLDKPLRIGHREEQQQIEAMVADTTLAAWLALPIGAPVLLVTRRLRLQGRAGRVLFKSYYRADRYVYTVNLLPAQRQPSARRTKT